MNLPVGEDPATGDGGPEADPHPLVKGYGPVAATHIMRSVHAGDVAGALALVDAAHAAPHTEPTDPRAATAAPEALAGVGGDHRARGGADLHGRLPIAGPLDNSRGILTR